MKFRRFINKSLDQHIHVAEPLLPVWKSKVEEDCEIAVLAILDKRGVFLQKSTFFHIGKCENDNFIGLVALYKNNIFMGGDIYIIDILLHNKPTLNLPSRYKIIEKKEFILIERE